jgi:molybdenum cofactor guanylyltransferase
MGRDKALIEVDGVALARRVADALISGGCDEVLAVGGDAVALGALGLTPVADRWAGEGPLGGLATALAAAWARSGEVLVVAPCDLLRPSPDAVAALLGALSGSPQADVAAGEVDRRVEWILSAWRPTTDLVATMTAVVEGGERRLDAVAPVARRVPCPAIDGGHLRDADRPSDLTGG